MDSLTKLKTLIELGRSILEEQAQEPTEAPEADSLLIDPKVLTNHLKPSRKSHRLSKLTPKSIKE